MENLLETLDQTLRLCAVINDEIRLEFRLASDATPISGLNMAHQHATLTIESVHHYYQIWRDAVAVGNVSREQQISENIDRLIILGKHEFIATLSSFEYCAKQALLTMPHTIPPLEKGKIYLGKILEASNRGGLVSDSDLHLWDGIREMRNCLVHNNGTSSITKIFSFDYAHEMKFVQGQQQIINMMSFPLWTQWAVSAYGEWCRNFLKNSDIARAQLQTVS